MRVNSGELRDDLPTDGVPFVPHDEGGGLFTSLALSGWRALPCSPGCPSSHSAWRRLQAGLRGSLGQFVRSQPAS
jgi:hypothetical protein